MAVSFITDSIREIYYQSLLSLIETMGRVVTIYYPGIQEDCENCVYDPIGKKSSNRYRTGGPIPFATGFPCPVCNSEGKRQKIVTENGKFLCNWNLNDNFGNDYYINIGNVRLPKGFCLLRGKIEYLTKFRACDYFIIQGFEGYRFKVASEPTDPGSIVQDKMCSVVGQRV